MGKDEAMMVVTVAIIGAGPAGLATAACLVAKHKLDDFVIFEREDCCASLWRRRAYDRLHLHLAKKFCALPHKPHSPKAPNFLSRQQFLDYIDDYVSDFNIKPNYCHSVTSASYLEDKRMWKIEVLDAVKNNSITYSAKFLVVATGENSEPLIPSSLSGFKGTAIHSSQYKSGKAYRDMDVLVVGAGNSGFEISYDLFNHGARTSLVVRSPVHVVSRRMIEAAMTLIQYLPVWIVDFFLMLAARLRFGDLSRYGIAPPRRGPFQLKLETGRTPTIDVGALDQIKKGDIKVFPAITKVDGKDVEFEDGTRATFDAMILATGYKSSACSWLQGYECILNEKGLPKSKAGPPPTQYWKGKNGAYCVGLMGKGLHGVSHDALNVADDIATLLATMKKASAP
ncbi:hypothetical protein Dimus_017063 [Dionaea muscipula]